MTITNADLKRHRDRLRETQDEFAKRFGVARTTLLHWEAAGIPKFGPTRQHIERVLAGLAVEASQAAE